MRQGVVQSTWHTHYRAAFGRVLDEQPLMRNVLAGLCLESEAATVSAMRLARAFDADPADEHEQHLKRLVTPIVKYWTCKRAPVHAAESLECLGGAGYVEESDLPRLFRESPLNGIWEGSGNVICLDVLRAMGRERLRSTRSARRCSRRRVRTRASARTAFGSTRSSPTTTTSKRGLAGSSSRWPSRCRRRC